MASKKHVVVVGGGAGAQFARVLSGKLDETKYELTLISAHPYLVLYLASLRMLVTKEGSLENRILIPYDKLFVNGNGKFRQGVVTAIEAEKGSKKGGRIVLEDGEAVAYDVLVLAPGTQWESFLKFPQDDEKVRKHIQEWREKFGSARKVVIAGGGAVGVELAGELKYYYPDTKVTIVHGDKKLLNQAYPDKFRDDLARRVRAAGIDLILDDYIDTFPANVTRNGAKLDADLVVPARGGRPNTLWIASSLGQEVLTKSGCIRIKPTLQLEEYPSIFAIGDVIDSTQQKQLGKAGGHIDVVAPNVMTLLTGAEPQKIYKSPPELIMVTIGKTRGAFFAGILWGLMFGNWFTSSLKGKGLFIGMIRKTLGHPG